METNIPKYVDKPLPEGIEDLSLKKDNKENIKTTESTKNNSVIKTPKNSKKKKSNKIVTYIFIYILFYIYFNNFYLLSTILSHKIT